LTAFVVGPERPDPKHGSSRLDARIGSVNLQLLFSTLSLFDFQRAFGHFPAGPSGPPVDSQAAMSRNSPRLKSKVLYQLRTCPSIILTRFS
jgi:hypothetical protein